MAEGWTRHLKGGEIEPSSAGTKPQGLNPVAVKIMKEAGVDLSLHKSKHIDEVKHIKFDYVITVCDNAKEQCPLFPGNVKKIHVGFDDPPGLSLNARNEEEALEHYRRVRDEIKNFVESLLDALA